YKVGAVFSQGIERIDDIAQTFRHLIPVLVKHETIGYYVPEGEAGIIVLAVYLRNLLTGIIDQNGDGMQSKEPATGLVYAFSNKISRVVLFEDILVFKRVVPLRVGHGAGIEPDVD